MESAIEQNGTLEAAITQDENVIWSMHNKKNVRNLLSGEMILTFFKRPLKVRIRKLSNKCGELDEIIESLLLDISQNSIKEFTTDFLFNRIVIKAWNMNKLSEIYISPDLFYEKLRDAGLIFSESRNRWIVGSVEDVELKLRFE